jgi:hypothetical protein
MKFLLLLFVLGIGGLVVGANVDWSAIGWGTVGGSGSGNGFAAPELDPGAAGAAMVLLLGGLAYFASRRREDSLS